jgi:hypothetical protein
MTEKRYDERGRSERIHRQAHGGRRLGGPSAFHYRRLEEGRVARWKAHVQAERRRAKFERLIMIALLVVAVAVLTILAGLVLM